MFGERMEKIKKLFQAIYGAIFLVVLVILLIAAALLGGLFVIALPILIFGAIVLVIIVSFFMRDNRNEKT